MSKIFKQNVESVRLIEVVDYLIDRQTVESDADFCRKLGFSQKSFSHLRRGKRNAPTELISKMYAILQVNPIFIHSGLGEKVITGDGINLEPSEAVQGLMDELKYQKELIRGYVASAEANLKYIKHLESELECQKAELLK